LMHLYINIYIYLYVYKYIYICVYIYIYMGGWVGGWVCMCRWVSGWVGVGGSLYISIYSSLCHVRVSLVVVYNDTLVNIKEQ